MAEDNVQNYDNASDLPSVVELRAQVKAMQVFELCPGKAGRIVRETIKNTEKNIDELVHLVDKFYNLLGNRNWIFSDSFPISDVKEIINTDNPDVAEKRLIDWYSSREHIELQLRMVQSNLNVRERMPLIRKAVDDFCDGRYYSTVFILISQVDGLVNDTDPKKRRALSARESDDMKAYDSATAVTEALPRISEIYRKGFHKFSGDQVHDLYRNGIMHGELIDFDNVIVATKAWNLLFAATDWAKAQKERAQQLAKPAQDPVTFQDLIKLFEKSRKNQESVDKWKPYETGTEEENPDPSGIRKDSRYFFSGWEQKNYRKIAEHVANPTERSIGRLTLEVKEEYASHPIQSTHILKIENVAGASAFVTVELEPGNGDKYQTRLQWIRVKSIEDYDTAFPYEDGTWMLIRWKVDPFKPNANM